MGWDFCSNWKKKADVVAERVGDYSNDSNYELLAHKTTKSGLWTVVRNRQTGLKGICFDLIECQLGDWGVKSMDEGMGPYSYDCPRAFLEMVPAAESFNFNPEYRARWTEANR